MRVWFIPFLFLSILIGWTLGLTACARTAEQGWIPADPPERMELPMSSDGPWGLSVEGMRGFALGASLPDPSASDAGPAAPEPDAGR